MKQIYPIKVNHVFITINPAALDNPTYPVPSKLAIVAEGSKEQPASDSFYAIEILDLAREEFCTANSAGLRRRPTDNFSPTVFAGSDGTLTECGGKTPSGTKADSCLKYDPPSEAWVSVRFGGEDYSDALFK